MRSPRNGKLITAGQKDPRRERAPRRVPGGAPRRTLRVGVSAAGLAAGLFAGACQVVSGLGGLEAEPEGDPASSTSSEASSSAGTGIGGAGTGGSGGATGGTGGGGATGSTGTGDAATGTGGAAGGCELMPSSCPTLLVADTMVPVDMLTIDDKGIYWAHRGAPGSLSPTGSIWRASLDGSGVTQLVSSVAPAGLVVYPAIDRLFWSDNFAGDGQLYHAPTGGDVDPVLAAKITGPIKALAILPPNDVLFFSAPSQKWIEQIIVSSGAPPAYFADSGGDPAVIATDGSYIYWHADGGQTMRRQVSGQSITESFATPSASFGIDVYGSVIYGAVRADQGLVWAFDISSSVIAPLAQDAFPSYVLQKNNYLYWSSDGAVNCIAGSGEIKRRSVDPSTLDVARLATLQDCPSNLVASGGFIYWGDASRRIFRAPTP